MDIARNKTRDVGVDGNVGNSGSHGGRNLIAVIGIDSYQHQRWPSLSNAVNDAHSALTLFEQLGFTQAAPTLIDSSATGRAIQTLVTDDLATLAPEDNLVLFYAGHGGNRKHRVGDHEITTGYLVPVDAEDRIASWVELEAWLRCVALLPAKHILVILDACHSGIALDPVIRWRDSTSRDEPLPALRARTSRRIITSARGDQRAMDGGPYPGHSLFTGCLIEALTHGLRRNDRVTTGSELGLHLQRRVGTYPQSQQTPDFGTFAFDQRGEMVLSLVLGHDASSPTLVESRSPFGDPMALSYPDAQQIAEGKLETSKILGVIDPNSLAHVSDQEVRSQVKRFLMKLKAMEMQFGALHKAPGSLVGYRAWLNQITALENTANAAQQLRALVAAEERERRAERPGLIPADVEAIYQRFEPFEREPQAAADHMERQDPPSTALATPTWDEATNLDEDLHDGLELVSGGAAPSVIDRDDRTMFWTSVEELLDQPTTTRGARARRFQSFRHGAFAGNVRLGVVANANGAIRVHLWSTHRDHQQTLRSIEREVLGGGVAVPKHLGPRKTRPAPNGEMLYLEFAWHRSGPYVHELDRVKASIHWFVGATKNRFK